MQKQPDIIISTADLAELEYQLERSKLPEDFVRAIENELDRATILPCKDMPEDVVVIGSQVTFKILDTQRTFTKTLCLPDNTIKFEDSISVFAPIGSALIGLRTGQCISWQTQRGKQSVEIIQVNNPIY
ncbi:GreA/GreB family elongation factor [Paraglaciecola sp. L3A3]|uniref:GreA/GreB family elongation factor n=1 Tax=Paraglaciecola sp. L3A3 TaxID=2686358 RepID=UPI00131BE227|nr:GreA/GreB family elongation factor [Paraglaciecola sp. L3A3]